MGNTNIRSQQLQSNQAYGDFQLITNNNTSIVKVVKLIERESNITRIVKYSLANRSQLKHQNICQLYEFKMKTEQSIIEIELYYEYYGVTLANKFNKLNEYIAGDQLMKIIDEVSSALRCLHSKKIKHGCINFNTILCSPEGYKITDVSSTNQTLMELTQKGSKNEPISRKIINFINQITIKALVIKQISLEDDLFSLGMVVLSLATNTKIGFFYHHQIIEDNLQIALKEQTIQDYLFLLKKRYCKTLYNTVRRLIFIEPSSKANSFVSMQLNPNLNQEIQQDIQMNEQYIFNCSIRS